MADSQIEITVDKKLSCSDVLAPQYVTLVDSGYYSHSLEMQLGKENDAASLNSGTASSVSLIIHVYFSKYVAYWQYGDSSLFLIHTVVGSAMQYVARLQKRQALEKVRQSNAARSVSDRLLKKSISLVPKTG